LWDRATRGEKDSAEGRADSLEKFNASLNSSTAQPLSYLEKRTISKLSQADGNAGAMDELQRHPLTIMFSFIMSQNFIGLDVSAINTVKAFKNCISIAFMAKIFFVMIRTGIL
jgi:hypothetical protein